MSTTVVAYLVYGIPCTRGHFLVEQGTERVCSYHHVVLGPGRYCPEHGSQVETRPREVPTGALVRAAAAAKMDPMEMWDHLYAGPGNEESGRLGVVHVSALVGDQNQERRADAPLAFGSVIASAPAYKDESWLQPLSPPDDLAAMRGGIQAEAEKFGIKGEPRLFAVTYYS